MSGSKIPKYAAHVPREQLVRLLCHCERQTVYAQLVYRPDDQLAEQDNKRGFKGYVAECLKCHREHSNSFGWTRV